MSSLISESMLRYLYNEMSFEESVDFLFFIETNSAMMEQFSKMKEVYNLLNNINFSPSHKTIDRIMSYASMGGFSMQ